MKFKDYYKVMGVGEDAGAEEIKRAYRKLARKYHPDVSPEADAEERFKELGEAYEVLKDPEKRQEYDQLRKYGFRDGSEFRPPPGWTGAREFTTGGFEREGVGQFSDFFEALFGQRGGFGGFEGFTRGQRRGRDLHYRLGLSLEEAFRGGERSIHVQTPELTPDGNLVTRNRSLNVQIPAGVTDGQQIRLRGQGEPAAGGGTPGDLYLEVELKPHRLFALDGKNVLLRLPVAPWEAALGATVKVPTLGGAVSLRIPPNAKAGQKLRLKGRGLPGPTAGDQIVELQLVLPEVRGAEEKELLTKLAEALAFDPRADLKA